MRTTLTARLRAVLAGGLFVLLSTQIPVAAPASAGPPEAVRAASVTGHRDVGVAAGGVIQYESAAQRDAYLDSVRDLGATWLRFDLAWTNVQNSGPSSFDWGRYDRLVAAAGARGLNVLGMIGYSPSWARDQACPGEMTCRPADAGAYARFAGQVAARYGPRGVHHWEIWNEPNLTQFFRPAPDPAFYTRMLSGAYTAIHAADPRAIVVTGGLSPASTSGADISPADFLARIYDAGAKGHFDALGHHPYCYEGGATCTASSASWSAWAQMSTTSRSLRGELTAHADGGKPIWATEFGAPTSGSSSVSEQEQASMLVQGVRTFSAYSWSGPLFLYSLRDRGTNRDDREDWFGVIRADGSRKPAYAKLAAAIASVRGTSPARTQPSVSPAPQGVSATSSGPLPSVTASAPPPGAASDRLPGSASGAAGAAAAEPQDAGSHWRGAVLAAGYALLALVVLMAAVLGARRVIRSRRAGPPQRPNSASRS